ncbi:hypothetical protein [Psychrobacter sp.]|uniref:hypothetical protein n=1 Tax=Psychrobacter sp. TaxID=56811 RepID=UPI003BB18C0E
MTVFIEAQGDKTLHLATKSGVKAGSLYAKRQLVSLQKYLAQNFAGCSNHSPNASQKLDQHMVNLTGSESLLNYEKIIYHYPLQHTISHLKTECFSTLESCVYKLISCLKPLLAGIVLNNIWISTSYISYCFQRFRIEEVGNVNTGASVINTNLRNANDDTQGANDDTQGANDDNQGANDDNQGANDDNQGANDDNQGANDDNQGANDDNQGANDDTQSANDDTQSANDDNQDANDDNQGANDDNQGAKNSVKAKNTGLRNVRDCTNMVNTHIGICELNIESIKVEDRSFVICYYEFLLLNCELSDDDFSWEDQHDS